MKWAMFFLGEYMNMIVISSICVTLFFGGWHGPGPAMLGIVWYLLKLFALLFFFIWVRWTFPRLRYDQLMNFGWKVLLPGAIANIADRDPVDVREGRTADGSLALPRIRRAARRHRADGDPAHRNPVTSALFLVLSFCSLAGIYLLLRAEFLGMVQMIVYAGAIMVLFLFVIMYLNLQHDVETGAQIAVRRGIGWMVGAAAAPVRGAAREPRLVARSRRRGAAGAGQRQRGGDRQGALLAVPVPVRDHVDAAARRHGRRHRAGQGAHDAVRRGGRMIPLGWTLALSAILFCIGVVGVLVRRNALVIFMSIELMLNAANLAFVALASHLNSLDGQIFVFFVMTVAAAEVAVGLAIIVNVFRLRETVFVDEINLLKG